MSIYISIPIGFVLWSYLLSRNTAFKVMPFPLLMLAFGMAISVLLTGEIIIRWKMLAVMEVLLTGKKCFLVNGDG